MSNRHFFVTGGENLVLHTADNLSECSRWARSYVSDGDFGGHPYLKVWEWGVEDDTLCETIEPEEA